jgi:hypothetical protein
VCVCVRVCAFCFRVSLPPLGRMEEGSDVEHFVTPKKRQVDGNKVVSPVKQAEKSAKLDVEGEESDRAHALNCRATRKGEFCGRCAFIRWSPNWVPKLPLLPADLSADEVTHPIAQAWLGKSWMATSSNRDTWGIGCIACASKPLKGTNAFGNYSVALNKGNGFAVMQRHQNTKSHRENVMAFLHISVGPTGLSTSGSPSREEFLKVVKVATDAQSIRPGIDGVGGRKRCGWMMRCLCEAMMEEERKRIMDSKVIGLQRDEANGLLWFRFRCITKNLEFFQGIIGCGEKEFKGANGILKATDVVFQQFSTPGLMLDPKNNKLDKDCYRHLRQHLEMVNVDSAADELLASSIMRTEVIEDNHGVAALAGQPLNPNMRVTIRDKTHATRRRPVV